MELYTVKARLAAASSSRTAELFRNQLKMILTSWTRNWTRSWTRRSTRSGQHLKEKLDEKLDYNMNKIWTRSGGDPDDKIWMDDEVQMDEKIWTKDKILLRGNPANPMGTLPTLWGPCQPHGDPAPTPWGPCPPCGDPANPMESLPTPWGLHQPCGLTRSGWRDLYVG